MRHPDDDQPPPEINQPAWPFLLIILAGWAGVVMLAYKSIYP
jgi:hypothetical protein